MHRVRMFLEQRKLHYLILYTLIVDVTLGYLMKIVPAFNKPLPVVFLALANIIVILAVYRFWLLPIFECDDSGFAVYGISPFTKDRCQWAQLEYVYFKDVEDKKGRINEMLVLTYALPGGLFKTNIVPMYMVWKRDDLKKEFLGFLRRKGIKPKSPPGL